MGMGGGGGVGGLRAEINITPLVDVVLVLLIIFMVVTPLLQMGHEVSTPPKVESAIPPPTPQDQLVLRIDAQSRMYINQEEIPPGQFPSRLESVMKGRSKKLAFFAADGDLPYEKVAEFLDICRNHGAKELGIVFDDLR